MSGHEGRNPVRSWSFARTFNMMKKRTGSSSSHGARGETNQKADSTMTKNRMEASKGNVHKSTPQSTNEPPISPSKKRTGKKVKKNKKEAEEMKRRDAFVCKALGMDDHGMCLRHPNQLITVQLSSPHQYEETHLCRLCTSEEKAGPKAPLRQRRSIAKVFGQVTRLQPDRQNWREAINALYYRSYEQSGAGGGNNVDIMDMATLTAVLSEEDWEEQLKARVQQVSDWANKNALREHPIFHKYYRMHALGIPLDAAKTACERDGHDPRVLDLNANQSLELQLDGLDPETADDLREYVVQPDESTEVSTDVSAVVVKVRTSFHELRATEMFKPEEKRKQQRSGLNGEAPTKKKKKKKPKSMANLNRDVTGKKGKKKGTKPKSMGDLMELNDDSAKKRRKKTKKEIALRAELEATKKHLKEKEKLIGQLQVSLKEKSDTLASLEERVKSLEAQQLPDHLQSPMLKKKVVIDNITSPNSPSARIPIPMNLSSAGRGQSLEDLSADCASEILSMAGDSTPTVPSLDPKGTNPPPPPTVTLKSRPTAPSPRSTKIMQLAKNRNSLVAELLDDYKEQRETPPADNNPKPKSVPASKPRTPIEPVAKKSFEPEGRSLRDDPPGESKESPPPPEFVNPVANGTKEDEKPKNAEEKAQDAERPVMHLSRPDHGDDKPEMSERSEDSTSGSEDENEKPATAVPMGDHKSNGGTTVSSISTSTGSSERSSDGEHGITSQGSSSTHAEDLEDANVDEQPASDRLSTAVVETSEEATAAAGNISHSAQRRTENDEVVADESTQMQGSGSVNLVATSAEVTESEGAEDEDESLQASVSAPDSPKKAGEKEEKPSKEPSVHTEDESLHESSSEQQVPKEVEFIEGKSHESDGGDESLHQSEEASSSEGEEDSSEDDSNEENSNEDDDEEDDDENGDEGEGEGGEASSHHDEVAEKAVVKEAEEQAEEEQAVERHEEEGQEEEEASSGSSEEESLNEDSEPVQQNKVEDSNEDAASSSESEAESVARSHSLDMRAESVDGVGVSSRESETGWEDADSESHDEAQERDLTVFSSENSTYLTDPSASASTTKKTQSEESSDGEDHDETSDGSQYEESGETDGDEPVRISDDEDGESEEYDEYESEEYEEEDGVDSKEDDDEDWYGEEVEEEPDMDSASADSDLDSTA